MSSVYATFVAGEQIEVGDPVVISNNRVFKAPVARVMRGQKISKIECWFDDVTLSQLMNYKLNVFVGQRLEAFMYGGPAMILGMHVSTHGTSHVLIYTEDPVNEEKAVVYLLKTHVLMGMAMVRGDQASAQFAEMFSDRKPFE